MPLAQVEKAWIRREGERLFGEPEVGCVHKATRSACERCDSSR
jgi:hypothetical protein